MERKHISGEFIYTYEFDKYQKPTETQDANIVFPQTRTSQIQSGPMEEVNF